MEELHAMLAKAPPEEHEPLLRSADLFTFWERFSREPVWRRCRHGGPDPTPVMMDMVEHLLNSLAACTATSAQHAHLLETPIIKDGCSPPPLVFASMGVDAWLNDDIQKTRKFVLVACVLAATSGPAGPQAVFNHLR